jgi:thiamine kinase-like enzyme
LSHSLKPHFSYPSDDQQEEFYRAYLSIEMSAANGEEVLTRSKDVGKERVERLRKEVQVWSPACSVFWSLWGIIQAEEQIAAVVEGRDEKPDFDYLVSENEVGTDARRTRSSGWRCLERRLESWACRCDVWDLFVFG